MSPLTFSKVIGSIFCYISNNWLSLVSLVVSGTLVIITWIKNVRDRRLAHDKELAEQLKFSLEEAYGSIALSAQDGDIPKKDRLGWLAAARHIVRYWELRKAMKTRIYGTICDEQEEYWRHRFYLLLQRIKESRFFVWIDQDQNKEETIEPKSAAIVYAFSQWNEGLPDPLDTWSFEEIVAQYNLFSPLNRPFREFIEARFPGLVGRGR